MPSPLPPLRKPVREQKTPSCAAAFFTEIVDRNDAVYQQNSPIPRGTLYSTMRGGDSRVAAAYPTLFFLREQKVQLSDSLVFWSWATENKAESAFNAEVTYLSESVAHPGFARSYIVRRDDYDAFPSLAPGTPLTALLGVKITAGGSGYTAPEATFGVAGSGASVQFVLNTAGAIISCVVLNEGTGFTDASTVTIADSSGGTGTGATATCIVQPVTAILTSQKKIELPADDPMAHEFVSVLRTYERIPGPVLPGKIKRKPRVTPAKYIRSESVATSTQEVTTGTDASTPINEGDESKVTPQDSVKALKEDSSLSIAKDSSATEYKLNDDGQIATVASSLSSSLPSAPTVDGKTVEASVSELSPTEFESVVATVPAVLALPTDGQQQTVEPPRKFLNITGETTHEETVEDTAVTPDALGSDGLGVVESSATQETKFKGRKKKRTRAGTLSSSLTEYKKNEAGQLVTVVGSYGTDGSAPTISATTEIADVEAQGDGKFVKTVGNTSSVFGDQEFTEEIPDLTPPEFKALVPTTTTAATVAGTAATPTLGTGDLSATEQQVTVQKKRTRRTTRTPVTLPVTITDTTTTAQKQVASVAKTLEATGTSSATPSATQDVSVTTLGDGREVEQVTSVPEVFSEEKFSKEIPDTTPAKFRALLKTSTHSEVSAGTAAEPTLGAGELSRSSEQITEFTVRENLTSRDAASLPESLTQSRVTPQGQVETVVETLATGVQTVTASATTVEANVENLGNGTSLKTVGTVASVFGENTFTKEIPDLVPQEFRGAAPITETSEVVAGTAATPTLSAGDLSASEDQVTVQKKRTRLRTRAGITLPVTLTGKRTNARKQVESVSKTLEADTTTPTTPNATRDVTFTKLGDGNAVEEVVTVSSVFPEARYSKERPDATPTEFRALLNTVTESSVSAGTAAAPTLSTGELSRSSEQETAFTKRDSVTSRDAASLPATLVDTRTNPKGQVVTVTKILEADTTTPATPSATQDVSFTKLGDGTAVEQRESVPEVFSEVSYSVETPDVVPQEFRAALSTTDVEQIVAGTATAPTLGAGDIEASEKQESVFLKRTRVKNRDLSSLPVTLSGSDTNSQKQTVAVTKTLDTATSGTASNATTDVQVTPLGNGMFVEEIRAVDEVFDAAAHTKSVSDLVPEKFKAALPVSIDEAIVTGTAATPTLSAGDLEKSEEQVTKFTKRTRSRSRAGVTLPVSITGKETNARKQVVSVTETLEADTTTPTAPSATTDVTFEKLGDGTAVEIVKSVPSVFAEAQYRKERADVTPELFKALIPVVETGTTAAGTASAPTLGAGDLSATDQQVDAFTHRTTTTSRAAVSLPVSSVDKDTNAEGQVETITRTLEADTTTPATPTATKNVKFTKLGDGTAIEEATTIPAVLALPTDGQQQTVEPPRKFLSITGETTHEETVEDTAVAPDALGSDGLGIVESSATQETKFKGRKKKRTRTGTLAESVTEYERNAAGQTVTLTQSYGDDGDAPTVDALTEVAKVEAQGDGKFVKTLGTVESVFTQAKFAKERINPIPAEFRDAVSTYVVESTTAGTATYPGLSSSESEYDLSASSEQVTAQKVRNRVEFNFFEGLPVTLSETATTPQGQVATTQKTLDITTDTGATVDALTQIKTRELGDGHYVNEVTTVPSLFAGTTLAAQRPDITPEKFKAAIPVTTTEQTVTGAAAAPTLGSGDLEKSEEQATEFTKRTRTRNRSAVSLPVSVTGKETNQRKQVVSVTETLAADTATPATPSATQDVTFEKLGDGTAIQVVKAVPAVFDEATYSKEVPDIVPQEFRVAVPTVVADHITAGTAAAPTLSTGDLEKSETQLDAFTKRTRSRSRAAVTLPVSLAGKETNREKQDVTVTQTLKTSGSDTAATALIDVEVKSLGDGTVIETTREKPEVFAAEEHAAQRPDITPEKFKALIPIIEDSSTAIGTAASPTLGAGDLSASEQQLDAFTKRTRTRNRSAASLPATIVSKKTNARKQIVTVTETLEVDTTTPATPSATQGVTFEKLGDGNAVETVESVSAVFGENSYSKEIPDVVPVEFRTAIPTATTAVTTAGTAAAPTLGSGDLSAEQRQLDVFTKSTTTRARAAVSVPASLSESRLIEGLNVPITKTIDDGVQTFSPDFKTLSADVRNLGNGQSVKEIAEAASFPQQAGQKYDRTLDIVLPYTVDTKALGADIGDARKEITPQDYLRAKVQTVDATAAAAAFDAYSAVFPGTASISFPDVLAALDLSYEEHKGLGDSSTSGSGSWSGSGSYSVPAQSATEASHSVIPDLSHVIQQKWSRYTPTIRAMFLLPMPATQADALAKLTTILGDTVTAWPKFNPGTTSARLIGRSVSIRVEANYHIQDGGSLTSSEHAESGGTSKSIQVGLTVKNVTLPPTIHGSFTGGLPSASYFPSAMSLTATAWTETITVDTISPGGAYAIFGTDATDGDTVIPTTGLRLLSLEGEPHELNYALFHAEVVDFTTI